MNLRNLFKKMIFAGVLALSFMAGASYAKEPAAGAAFQAANVWFQTYSQAWIHLDATAATRMFTRDAVYVGDPFEPPLRGEQEIRKYWDAVAHGQRDVRVDYQILSVEHNKSLVLWRASFIRVVSQQKVQLEGIAEVTLNKDGKCVFFREWWNRKKT